MSNNNFEIIRADQRGKSNMGWLTSRFSFSFAQWYNPERIQFGALRVINDDIIAPECGFDMHPHDNMEIITIVRKGELKHKDSMGHESFINPGEVQVMSAGTGIFHSEYNHSENENLELFQIWIFPDALNHKPRYDQKRFDFSSIKNASLLLVDSFQSNEVDSLKINQNARIEYIHIENGFEMNWQKKEANNGLYFLIIEGEIEINGNLLNKRDAINFPSENSIQLKSNTKAEIIVFEVPMN